MCHYVNHIVQSQTVIFVHFLGRKFTHFTHTHPNFYFSLSMSILRNLTPLSLSLSTSSSLSDTVELTLLLLAFWKCIRQHEKKQDLYFHKLDCQQYRFVKKKLSLQLFLKVINYLTDWNHYVVLLFWRFCSTTVSFRALKRKNSKLRERGCREDDGCLKLITFSSKF